MAWLAALFVLIAGAVVQVLLPPATWLAGAKTPVLLSVVLYYALHRPATVALLVAFAAGFLQDALSPIPFGYSMLVFCGGAWITGFSQRLVLVDSVVTPVFFGAVGTFVASLLTGFMLTRAGAIALAPHLVLFKALGAAALGALAAPVVFVVMRKLDHVSGVEEMGEGVQTWP